MLPRQLRIISKQSPLDLVGLAGCACKEAGSKWGWTLALDVPWAGSDRVHGGRDQGGCSGRIGCTLRPAALGCGVLAWGLLLRGIHSTTLTWQHHAQGRVPGTWCPHISLEILISLISGIMGDPLISLAHHVHSAISPLARSAEATDSHCVPSTALRWGDCSDEDQQSLLLRNWHLKRNPPRIRKF